MTDAERERKIGMHRSVAAKLMADAQGFRSQGRHDLYEAYRTLAILDTKKADELQKQRSKSFVARLEAERGLSA
jgi:hypothetical protein